MSSSVANIEWSRRILPNILKIFNLKFTQITISGAVVVVGGGRKKGRLTLLACKGERASALCGRRPFIAGNLGPNDKPAPWKNKAIGIFSYRKGRALG